MVNRPCAFVAPRRNRVRSTGFPAKFIRDIEKPVKGSLSGVVTIPEISPVGVWDVVTVDMKPHDKSGSQIHNPLDLVIMPTMDNGYAFSVRARGLY